MTRANDPVVATPARRLRPLAVGVASLLVLALGASTADARAHVRRHLRRAAVVEAGGLIPGTYPADYGRPGYGCRTSVFAGNAGGCGVGWAYEGGLSFGYR